MAACRTCGTKVGMLSTECGSCAEQRRAAEQEAAKAAHMEGVRAQEARRDAYVQDAMSRLRATLAGGRAVFLHEAVHIPVDSVVDGEQFAPFLDLVILQTLGWEGWEVVGVIPRTVGVSFLNTSGGMKSYGGGAGGNVAGAHVIVRLCVEPKDAQAAEPVMLEHLARTFRG